ncbi:MAG: primosomal protein N' [Candidatus Solibacter sp.]|nr:primosomal protein N' [Candidatus Solibacter sp.]
MESNFSFVDVSLPVPLDRPFTYSLPETLASRVKPGCRVIVPFGSRTLTGVALKVHNDDPGLATRPALKLVDTEPVFDQHLMALGRWIADYYCAPLGEVLRTMAPLGGELRRGKVWGLTERGRDMVRQAVFGELGQDPAVQILHAVEKRPLAETTLENKVPGARKLLKTLEAKGLVEVERELVARDPARAASDSLLAAFKARPEGAKLKKVERELIAFLELHPGSHNLAGLEKRVKGAGAAARALGRQGLIELETAGLASDAGWARPAHALSQDQQAAVDSIRGALEAGRFQTFLLHGVTGSGKTEVYMNAIDAALKFGRGALLMVPEIGLTPAAAGQFQQRFGDQVAILHSAFNDRDRANQWRRLSTGKARVGVGTRSAVFAPVPDLGLIIVDEEHDQSYKQQESPRYHGRDLAIVRAQSLNAAVVLGSATPSLESRYNVTRGKSTLLELPGRIGGRPMPVVEVVDMRQEFLETRKNALFSRRLVQEMGANLDSGEQSMLLLNRRGFSSAVACRSCGERIGCLSCAVGMTFHRRDNRLLCHYCDSSIRVPQQCPACGSDYIHFLGSGSEKVEDELHRHFPRARVARLDRDTAQGKDSYERILGGFREHRFDILVGTQMIAKGHDIANVTLVGVVSADTGLGLPDFRAAERTFQLLTQVAGRAGRHHLPGRVVIQSLNPDHYAIGLAARQDYTGFYEKELEFRRLMRYPPFSALANILVKAEKEEDAVRLSEAVAGSLSQAGPDVKVLGPAEAPVARLKNEFRRQTLVKTASRPRLNDLLRAILQRAAAENWPAGALIIDVDPLSLL